MGIEKMRNDLYHYQNQAHSAQTQPQTLTLASMLHTQLQTPFLFHPNIASRNFFLRRRRVLDLLGKVMLVSLSLFFLFSVMGVIILVKFWNVVGLLVFVGFALLFVWLFYFIFWVWVGFACWGLWLFCVSVS